MTGRTPRPPRAPRAPAERRTMAGDLAEALASDVVATHHRTPSTIVDKVATIFAEAIERKQQWQIEAEELATEAHMLTLRYRDTPDVMRQLGELARLLGEPVEVVLLAVALAAAPGRLADRVARGERSTRPGGELP